MTGYGKSNVKNEYGELTVEIKSVNNRFLEINTHIPKSMIINEDPIRKSIQGYIKRGSIDIFFGFVLNPDVPKAIELDIPTVLSYITASKSLKDNFDVIDDLSTSSLLRFPDVLKLNTNDSNIWDGIAIQAVEKSLVELDDMRQTEGISIQNDMNKIVNNLNSQLTQVIIRAPLIVSEYRDKIKARIQELLNDYAMDEVRLLNEVAFFADKADINEEISRMSSHLKQFSNEINHKDCSGRKLDFISQEMTREVNTMCSKCNDISASKILIDMKSEVEKLKEQIRNVE